MGESHEGLKAIVFMKSTSIVNKVCFACVCVYMQVCIRVCNLPEFLNNF